ncbi:hypothetical protein J7Y63_004485 [Salmonella enterica]|nr:hypothetical protein [Salmonella enterica]
MCFKKTDNIIKEIIQEQADFDKSIRHLPLAEQKALREIEYERRRKESRLTTKTLKAAIIAFIPFFAWAGYCLITDAVLNNFVSIMGLLALSCVVTLVTEVILKKYIR